MPPKGHGGGTGGGGESPLGSAARSGSDAPYATAVATFLPAELRSAFRELPRFADALVPAPTQRGAQRAGAGDGGSRPSRSQAEQLGRCLDKLANAMQLVPRMSPDHAAALAELLSQEPAAAAALLRIHAAALRPGGGEWLRMTAVSSVPLLVLKAFPLPPNRHALSVLRFGRAMLRAQPFHALSRVMAEAATALEAGRGDGGGGAGSSSGGGGAGVMSGSGAGPSTSCGGAGSSSSGGALTTSGGRILGDGSPRVTGPRISSGGSSSASTALTAQEAKDVLSIVMAHVTAVGVVLGFDLSAHSGFTLIEKSVAHLAGVMEERAACLEEFARGLAESGFLEHAMRLTLMLQTRFPVAELRNKIHDKLGPVQILWRAVERGSGPGRLICEPPGPLGAVSAGRISPAAAAHLRSALGGRCVQTAVLVYGVGTLRLADQGPSYGLPTQLQTAGLALMGEDKDGKRCLDPVALELLLRQLASGSAQPPPGPGASLELALRVVGAALATAGASVPPALAGRLPPAPQLATPLRMSLPEALRLAVGALACGRLLLPWQRPSPRLGAQRAAWWRLATWAAVYGSLEPEEGRSRQLWVLVTEPLLAVWPDGRLLDLDALPPAAPPEVTEATAAGLHFQLSSLFNSASNLQPHDSFIVLTALLYACDEARPGGTGLALFLTPLLAYGQPQWGERLVGVLTALSQLPPAASGVGRALNIENHTRIRQSATSFLRTAAEALGRCRGLGPAAEAPAGPVEAGAEGGGEVLVVPIGAGTSAREPPPAHLLQLRRLLAPWLAAEAR
ncbi:hypothetical protein HYH03_011368 [Edaphochlamys debaryana]|uniref:Uncharacterized protein n=1 Tax=Edaphochlamys debaryana TaxID=47281 RepID=A0A835XUX7_9CHLO|nr:hypothetical protein HYH03_011368 [Edaphochlamys debaryana]|eukprot:KAG2490244.1 hypothetical protein HYH03_011368 [Edaphochlamys debaryana]